MTELIQATLDFAKNNTEYYKNLLRSVPTHAIRAENFDELPITTRDVFTSNVDAFLATSEFPDYVALTSGSTFGRTSKRPLIFYRSSAEREVWRTMVEGGSAPSISQISSIALLLLNINHGQASTLPAKGWFGLPLEKHYHFVALLESLRRRYAFKGFSERVEILVGTTNILKLLTLLCIENAVAARFEQKRSDLVISFKEPGSTDFAAVFYRPVATGAKLDSTPLVTHRPYQTKFGDIAFPGGDYFRASEIGRNTKTDNSEAYA